MQLTKGSANISGNIITLVLFLAIDIWALISWGVPFFLLMFASTVGYGIYTAFVFMRNSISVGEQGVMGKGSGVAFQLEYNQITSVGVGEGSDAKAVFITAGGTSYNVKVNKAAEIATIIQSNMEQLGIKNAEPIAATNPVAADASVQAATCEGCGAVMTGPKCEYCNR